MKLALGFGLVLMLPILIVIMAIGNMASMSNTTEEIVQDRYTKAGLSNSAIAAALDNSRSLRNLLLVETAEEIEKNKRVIQVRRNSQPPSLLLFSTASFPTNLRRQAGFCFPSLPARAG